MYIYGYIYVYIYTHTRILILNYLLCSNMFIFVPNYWCKAVCGYTVRKKVLISIFINGTSQYSNEKSRND